VNYKNANHILPDRLVQEIQQYVQGEYIYIPIKDKVMNTSPTEYEQELIKRNEHIYTKSLEGISNSELANMYHLSASSIRRIIIEQRKGYEAMNNKIRQIINEWDIEKKDVKQIYDSAWQIGEDYVLKTYEDVNMLQRNIKILTILEDRGIQVGGIVLTKDRKTYAKDTEYYYILTNKLVGSNITNIHKDTVIVSEMGKVLARLHKAFKECGTQDEFWDNSLLKEMNGWIKEVFVKNSWKYIDESAFCNLVDRLEKVYDKLPVQLIHRDVHLGNFLFDNGKFSGYIDFDLSQRNIRIFDLCYFMLGLLSEEEVLDISAEQWFEILKYFFAGYEQEHKLLPEEKQAVPYVMEAIEFLFVAWFMEQNDIKCAEDAMKIYQFVEKNEEMVLKIIDNSTHF
jgi:Ser/Thr protein kinase RdoA (MazF antagonist)